MKRILLSLMIIALASSTAIGATRAYFTSDIAINNMTMATGTLKINDTSDTWMQHVNFSNLKPGDTIRKWVKIQNGGTLDVASLKVSAVNFQGDVTLMDNITATVYGTVDGFDQGIYTPDWGTGQPTRTWLSNIDILGTAVYRDSTAAHVLSPTKTDTIIIDFRVPATLDDDWQGKSASFDLVFHGEQSHTGSSYF